MCVLGLPAHGDEQHSTIVRSTYNTGHKCHLTSHSHNQYLAQPQPIPPLGPLTNASRRPSTSPILRVTHVSLYKYSRSFLSFLNQICITTTLQVVFSGLSSVLVPPPGGSNAKIAMKGVNLVLADAFLLHPKGSLRMLLPPTPRLHINIQPVPRLLLLTPKSLPILQIKRPLLHNRVLPLQVHE